LQRIRAHPAIQVGGGEVNAKRCGPLWTMLMPQEDSTDEVTLEVVNREWQLALSMNEIVIPAVSHAR